MSDPSAIIPEQEVLTLIHMTLHGPKRSPGLGLTPLDPLTDPFRETVLDYAYNLLVGGILNGLRVVRSTSEGSLLHRLVKENRVRLPKTRKRNKRGPAGAGGILARRTRAASRLASGWRSAGVRKAPLEDGNLPHDWDAWADGCLAYPPERAA